MGSDRSFAGLDRAEKRRAEVRAEAERLADWELPLAEHGCLILANMFWTELIRGTVEVSGVVLDCSNVSADG